MAKDRRATLAATVEERFESVETAGKIGEVGLPAHFTAGPFAYGSRESSASAKLLVV